MSNDEVTVGFEILSEARQEEFDTAHSSLAKVLNNIVKNPEEAKYRQLRTSNAKIGALLATKGVRAILLGVGFVEAGEFLTLPAEAPTAPVQEGLDRLATQAAARAQAAEVEDDKDLRAAAAELERLQPGTFVCVHGLESRPELNGAIGRVSGALQENGRIPVRLGPPHERVFALKPANLEQSAIAEEELKKRLAERMLLDKEHMVRTNWRGGDIDGLGNVAEVVSSYQGNGRLRFNVGDLVECNIPQCGGWVSGEVVMLWYKEPHIPHPMPYQVRLSLCFLACFQKRCTEPQFPHSYVVGEAHVTRLQWASGLRPGR
jgi:hypothetical protein